MGIDKSICIIAGLMLFWVSTQVSIASESTNALSWGESMDDFQMASSWDTSNGVLHCWIRSSGKDAVAYDDFEFGYCENVALEIRQGTKWIRVYSEVFPGLNAARGAVPTDTKIRWLQPSQIMTNTWAWSDTVRRAPSRKEFDELLKTFHENANDAAMVQWNDARQTSLFGICKGNTFALDLINTQWPTNAFDLRSLKVRVRQDFYLVSPDDRYPYVHGNKLTLYSGVVTLDSSVIKTFLSQRYRKNTAWLNSWPLGHIGL
jgi:hypothetical protein